MARWNTTGSALNIKGNKNMAKTTTVVEMVDVVDKDDKVIRTAPREEVEGVERLRGVHVILADDEGNFVVQWRLATKRMSPRLFTASAAGMMASGEGYEACAKRELAEELGLHAKTLELLGAFQTNKGSLVNGQVFLAKWDGDMDALVGWETEAEGLDVWSLEEAEFMFKRFPYLLAPTFRESLKIYLKKMK